jgi:hypothetical protein
VNVSVNDVRSVPDTATSSGGFSVTVVADTAFESADIIVPSPLTDRIVIDEYVVAVLRPVTVIGLDVTPSIAGEPSTYTA